VNNILKKIFLFLIIIPFMLCGCWDQVPVEQTGFMTIVGIESSPAGDMKITYAMPVIDPTAKAREELLDTEASLTRVAREKLNRTSGKPMLAGKIQLVLYSKEIAEKGVITETNEIFERDPSDPILAWVVIVDGSTRELMHQVEKLKDKPRSSTYMDQLLERAVISAAVTETRVFNYDIISMAPGIDNIAPLMKLTSNSIEIKGSALFSKGKMVGTINVNQNGLLTAMMKTLKNRKFTYEASDINNEDNEKSKHGLAIHIGEKRKKINISIKDNKLVVDINLDLNGTIDEYKWDNLNDENKVKQLSEHVQEQIQKDCQNLIQYMQNIESDPIGIGDMVRAKHSSYFKRVDWHEAYKGSTITVHVKFNIIQYGAIQ
jgi:spore germination protein